MAGRDMPDGGRLRVGIVFGGQSAEHEISILSARHVLAALDPSRFEPVLIGIDKGGRWLIQDAQRLLSSARDPRLVHIEAGPAVQLPSPLGAPWTQPAGAVGRIDVIFPVLH
ncbi:MAG: D-alanine--D-alanine ligase A, partial [Steroidobacteraceae bacterium]